MGFFKRLFGKKKQMLTKEMLSESGMLDVAKYSKQDKGFYKSKDWLNSRKNYLESHPFCEVCLKDNIKAPATSVHHIERISQGGDAFDNNNLLAICRKCHGEIHTGIGVKINLSIFDKYDPDNLTPAEQWWESGVDKVYSDIQFKIKNLIKEAEGFEKLDTPKSIELYYEACKQIDDLEKILSEDTLVEVAYCEEFGVDTWRYIRFPINRLSMMLERSKRYDECIALIEDYNKKGDKIGQTGTDTKAIEKRLLRVKNKI